MSPTAVAPPPPREEEVLEEQAEALPPQAWWRQRRVLLVILGLLLLAGAAAWLRAHAGGAQPPAYRFATVERGDIEATVSATGTLAAVTTVQVGTQVSGQVSAIYADFNDRVKKGQLIARIDPTLQEQAVRDAEAGLDRTLAEMQKAQSDYARDLQLYESQTLTKSDFAATEYALASARADSKSAQVTLDKARQNLAYTSIYAPIDGIVVERNVDVGQTVAASLQAPQLFLIANDLSRMQILASVDESDIGQIHEGQAVHFTVQAYPQRTFRGTVRQVRLQSSTEENVVNYTVVVAVQNPAGILLPGMTATAAFVTGSATGVLLAPNAALRFRPSGVQPDTAPRLWYVGADGRLSSVRVTKGLNDGQRTVIEGTAVSEGMRVVTALAEGAPTTGTSSPFQPSRQGPQGRPF